MLRVRFALLAALLTACQIGKGPGADTIGGDGSGSGSGVAGECEVAGDCALVASTCCACPTYAVPITDPAHTGCGDVTCPTSNCPNNVAAACTGGACTVACVALACPTSCADGFVVDPSGCLECACATGASECTLDTDCAEVPADCCGCARGGRDTAVPASQVAAHDAALDCPNDPTCPDVDTCAPDLSVHCVSGTCELESGAGALPSNACGRADLAPCPSGTVCTVNADPSATMQGVGVCLPD